MDINTCLTLNPPYVTIAYYSHLIPILISLFLGVFVLVKSKFSYLSKIFFFFNASFCLWLLGDVVTWTQGNYNLISFIWSMLDYINIIFYLLGAYFIVVLVKGDDVKVWHKLAFISLSLPAWWLTFSNQSISSFYQPVCEALNNNILTSYKLNVEVFVVIFIVAFSIIQFKRSVDQKRKQILIVSLALLLFFIVFSATEYISSQTGIYEINLFSLFILPVFLFMIIYSITNLSVFKTTLVGTQLIAFVMIILVGSQFFFLENTTNQVLTVITFILSLSFGVLLVMDAKREIALRESLEIANEQQTTLIHFISHQIKGFLAKSRNLFSLFLEGDYGPLPEYLRQPSQDGLDSGTKGVETVMEILNAANLKKGTVTYKSEKIDVRKILEPIINDQKKIAEAKGLKFETHITDSESFEMIGDSAYITHALKNLVDNSIKYTLKGGIDVNLVKKYGKILFSVKDTGVGIDPEDVPQLFTEGVRGKDSIKVNVDSTGYGLYIVKKIVEGHKGRVWFESEGVGKGTTFFIELPSA
ncbi:MAG: HAMP domain-containing sensor histidine kinase [Nitrospira sp.]